MVEVGRWEFTRRVNGLRHAIREHLEVHVHVYSHVGIFCMKTDSCRCMHSLVQGFKGCSGLVRACVLAMFFDCVGLS